MRLRDVRLYQNYLLSEWMNQWMNSSGTHPSHKPPRRIHSRPTWYKWVHQTSDPERGKTQWQSTRHIQPSTPPLGNMVSGPCMGLAAQSHELESGSALITRWPWQVLPLSAPVCSAVEGGGGLRCVLVLPAQPPSLLWFFEDVSWLPQQERPWQLQESRAKGVGTGQCETYLSCSLHVRLDQDRSEGHTTLRDGPVEEILGQGR